MRCLTTLLRALLFAALLPVAVATADEEHVGDAHYLEGQLLVASPAMADPRFARTVILMVRHNANGAMGLVVNRQMGSTTPSNILREFGLKVDRALVQSEDDGTNIRVHYGGPVQLALGFVLHSADVARAETIVVGGVGLTAAVAMLRMITTGDGPRRRLFTLGYVGWAPGQLEAELARQDWVGVPADEDLIFDDDVDSKWRRAMAKRVTEL